MKMYNPIKLYFFICILLSIKVFADPNFDVKSPIDFYDELYTPIQDPSIDKDIAQAKGALNIVENKNAYSTTINPSELTELSIGVKEVMDNVEYAIVVTKAKFTPEYALINVYARIITSQQGVDGGKKELYFGAEDVKLSYQGKIIGEAKLSLLGNQYIGFNGNEWLITLEGGNINKGVGGNSVNDNTYVVIDCDGIKELALKCNVQISRNVLVPVDLNSGDIIEDKNFHV